jgi:hypothetical protein
MQGLANRGIGSRKADRKGAGDEAIVACDSIDICLLLIERVCAKWA